MRWLLPLLLVGCAPEKERDGKRTDSCESPGSTEVLVLSEIRFARETAGVSVGFDLDGETSTGGGSTGCGVADARSPDGELGIDNSFARLLPALELTEGAALELIVQEAINSGGLLAMVQLDRVDDPWDDSCVDMSVLGGVGLPMVGADGYLLPAQTFDRDAEVPESTVRNAVITDGVLEDGPVDLNLPFTFLDAEVVFNVKQGKLRLERQEEGRYTGVVGGGIAIQTLSDLAHNTGIGEEVEDLLDAVLGVSADLDPGPDGECRQISVTLEVEAIQAFFYED